MARFETEDDPGFVSIVGELRRWVKELKSDLITPEATASASKTLQTAGERSLNGPTNNVSRACYMYNTGGAHAVFGNPTYYGEVQIGR